MALKNDYLQEPVGRGSSSREERDEYDRQMKEYQRKKSLEDSTNQQIGILNTMVPEITDSRLQEQLLNQYFGLMSAYNKGMYPDASKSDDEILQEAAMWINSGDPTLMELGQEMIYGVAGVTPPSMKENLLTSMYTDRFANDFAPASDDSDSFWGPKTSGNADINRRNVNLLTRLDEDPGFAAQYYSPEYALSTGENFSSWLESFKPNFIYGDQGRLDEIRKRKRLEKMGFSGEELDSMLSQ